jgi:hypothetical protein
MCEWITGLGKLRKLYTSENCHDWIPPASFLSDAEGMNSCSVPRSADCQTLAFATEADCTRSWNKALSRPTMAKEASNCSWGKRPDDCERTSQRFGQRSSSDIRTQGTCAGGSCNWMIFKAVVTSSLQCSEAAGRSGQRRDWAGLNVSNPVSTLSPCISAFQDLRTHKSWRAMVVVARSAFNRKSFVTRQTV